MFLSVSNACKIENVVALLTYADSDHHTGYIYQACNFKYYGLTSPKKDFFILQDDGSYKKLQRGKCRHLKGEWRDKSQKHRYLIIYEPYETRCIPRLLRSGDDRTLGHHQAQPSPFRRGLRRSAE